MSEPKSHDMWSSPMIYSGRQEQYSTPPSAQSVNSTGSEHIPLYQRSLNSSVGSPSPMMMNQNLNIIDPNISNYSYGNQSYESEGYGYNESMPLELEIEIYDPPAIVDSILCMKKEDIDYVNYQCNSYLINCYPYENDYYYIEYEKKHKNKNDKNNNNNKNEIIYHPLPPGQNKYFQMCLKDFKYIEEKRLSSFSKNKNALGIPQSSNIYQPRKILDLSSIESNGFKHINWALKRQVETGFRAILLLEEYSDENIKDFNEYEKEESKKEREYCLKQLLNCLGYQNDLKIMDAGWICRLMTILKGRKLLLRSLKYLNDDSLYGFLKVFYSHLSFFVSEHISSYDNNNNMEWNKVDNEIMMKVIELSNNVKYELKFYNEVISIIISFDKVIHEYLVKNENCSTMLAIFLGNSQKAEYDEESKKEYDKLFVELGKVLNDCSV